MEKRSFKTSESFNAVTGSTLLKRSSTSSFLSLASSLDLLLFKISLATSGESSKSFLSSIVLSSSGFFNISVICKCTMSFSQAIGRSNGKLFLKLSLFSRRAFQIYVLHTSRNTGLQKDNNWTRACANLSLHNTGLNVEALRRRRSKEYEEEYGLFLYNVM